jgi:hypothetical protein
VLPDAGATCGAGATCAVEMNTDLYFQTISPIVTAVPADIRVAVAAYTYVFILISGSGFPVPEKGSHVNLESHRGETSQNGRHVSSF